MPSQKLRTKADVISLEKSRGSREFQTGEYKNRVTSASKRMFKHINTYIGGNETFVCMRRTLYIRMQGVFWGVFTELHRPQNPSETATSGVRYMAYVLLPTYPLLQVRFFFCNWLQISPMKHRPSCRIPFHRSRARTLTGIYGRQMQTVQDVSTEIRSRNGSHGNGGVYAVVGSGIWIWIPTRRSKIE